MKMACEKVSFCFLSDTPYSVSRQKGHGKTRRPSECEDRFRSVLTQVLARAFPRLLAVPRHRHDCAFLFPLSLEDKEAGTASLAPLPKPSMLPV